MEKTRVLAKKAAWQELSASWESEPAPLRPAHGYLTVPLSDSEDPSALLLCDPLTGLVAYPSFEAHMIAVLPALAKDGHEPPAPMGKAVRRRNTAVAVCSSPRIEIQICLRVL